MTHVTPARPTQVIIADDHSMVRAGLQRIVDNHPGMRVAAQAVDGESTLARLADTPCDVLMLDLTMPPPNGPDLIARIRSRWPSLPILVVTMHSDPVIAQTALQAGANGYITKDSDPETLIGALSRVAAGERFLEAKMMEAMIFSPLKREVPHEKLSPRELQVLKRLAAGQSNSQIAHELFLSEKTISTHKAHIMTKLNLGSTADLVRYADQHLRNDGTT